MTIEKVKLTKKGYLVNDNISVPNAEGNRHYKMVQEWLNIEGNVADPEFTQAEIDAELATKYQRDRAVEYAKLNQFEMQFDDEINGTTTWKDAILAIKAQFPKP